MGRLNLKSENQTRKLDNLGRVTIPKGLRDRLNLDINDEVGFYTMEGEHGDTYICLRAMKWKDPKYAAAVEVLKELGVPIPQVLEEKLL